MLVSEILETVRPAYCGTWDKVFEYFRSTPHEWRRVEELMAEIHELGQEEPGRIDFHERDEDDPEDQEEYYYLGNGTHRFAATVELGLEDYPVVYEEKSEGLGDFYQMTEVELWVKSRPLNDADEASELDDARLDCLDSSAHFRVAPGVWAECGGAGSQGIRSGIIYKLSFYPIPDEHLQHFLRTLLDRISCCVGPEDITDITINQATHFQPQWWGGKEDA